MKTTKKKKYTAPYLTVATVRTEQGYATSSITRMFRLGDAWSLSAIDPWSGSALEGNNLGGGWTDNGESAWS